MAETGQCNKYGRIDGFNNGRDMATLIKLGKSWENQWPRLGNAYPNGRTDGRDKAMHINGGSNGIVQVITMGEPMAETGDRLSKW